MDLKDFVERAIVDISEAVREADGKVRALGGLVNPGTHDFGSGKKDFVHSRTTLDFDIAVSAENTGKAGGDAKARIWVIEASVGKESSATSRTASRLCFSVDVVLPAPDDQMDRVGKVRKPKEG